MGIAGSQPRSDTEKKYVTYAFMSLEPISFSLLGTCPFWDRQSLRVSVFLALDTLESLALGTSPILGHALSNAGEMFALGTGRSKCLGHARFWDRPF